MSVPQNLCRWAPLVCTFFFACHRPATVPTTAQIDALQLKEGKTILCGPPQSQLGNVTFPVSMPEAQATQFLLGLKLLHSFEYDEAEKVFAGIVRADPSGYMGYWGIAMSNFHPLWSPPLPAELEKGAAAIALAQKLPPPTAREGRYLDAINAFYKDYKNVPHRTRCQRFEQAMDELQAAYPEDKEARILYALALDAAADPTDKTYVKQKKAGDILTALYKQYPDHPGVVHYLIHSYDIPGLAQNALPAARRYAELAPSSAHALHMPSHIFTRLGMWPDCVRSNREAAASAQCYAEQSGIKGHWDEELHCLDYMIYGYLQERDNQRAQEVLQYLYSIREVHPTNFKVAYAFAAIPARVVLENKDWSKAAALVPPQANFNWNDYPWQSAMIHFAKALGAIHTNDKALATQEMTRLQHIYDTLAAQQDDYKASQVAVQLLIARAWQQASAGQPDSAVAMMERAASKEDITEKHPVTPAEVLPAREQLGDLLLSLGRPREAIVAYEASLKKNPNRFNSLDGMAKARGK
ncbi:hypothetical protein ACWKWU_15515 [Chitinophaga lutea]